ncbi:MAG: HRDC domain-containing protein, partial [Candidatus Thermoplasmatota archaeon]|nr:HRDC domain-containing protein [Candidatus Thermoplasmatota archaeon]
LLLGKRSLTDLLKDVANKAEEKRYISHQVTEEVAALVQREKVPVRSALDQVARGKPRYLAEGLRGLARDLKWLSQRALNRNAGALLKAFDARVGYRAYLRENSGFEETGEGRARNVTALIDYARAHKSLPGLLYRLDNLAEAHRETQKAGELLDLRTIHRAKGLEWPVVILPHCNEATLPFSRAFDEPARIEEERRLMYVALTRSKRTTHLHHLEGTKLSRFLRQARHEETLSNVDRVGELLETSPRSWAPEDAVTLVQQTHRLHLERYLARWWEAKQGRKRAVGQVACTVIEQARDEDVLDRLDLDEEALAWWQATFEPPGELPAGGLGVSLAELLPEPKPEPASDPADPPGGVEIPEKELIHKLHYRVRVTHPEHGPGMVLEKKHRGPKKDLLVEFDGEAGRVWLDLNEEPIALEEAQAHDVGGASKGSGQVAGSGTPEGGTSEDGDALFEKLRAVRLELANEAGVPAFVVAHDSVLHAIVEQRPRSDEELLSIKGVGPHFLEHYGAPVLQALEG